MAKKKKSSMVKTIILACFFVAIILIYFNSLNNRTPQRRSKPNPTELEQLMEYDMVGEYPKTPRDLVKLHSRYYKLIYTSKIDDDDLAVLNRQMRKLYSAELQSYNPENSTLEALKKDLKKVDEKGYSYRYYTLPEASQIYYYTQNGVEMATMEVAVSIATKEGMANMYQQYVLVKEDDQWKIQGWGASQLGEN